MIRPHSGTLPAIPATPAVLPGAPLRHMAGVGKLPAVNPRPATAIVASRSLHGAILSRGAATPHKRVDEKGTGNSIPNALFNCNPLRMKREGYFLKYFLRPMPARPTRPRPISTMVPGSGTGAVSTRIAPPPPPKGEILAVPLIE